MFNTGLKGLLLTFLLVPFTTQASGFGLKKSYIVAGETGIPQLPYRAPEGVAYDVVKNQFIATAIFGGKITKIAGQSGAETVFYQETANPFLSFGGVKVDALRRIVWVCSADLVSNPSGPVGAVYAFHANTGAVLKSFPLPFPFFCNDVALDLQGNVYATNAIGPSVMKITPQAIVSPSGAATVFATNPLLLPDFSAPIVIGQNGIAVTPNNQYLLVAVSIPARLVRISFSNPSNVQLVTFSGDTYSANPNPAGDPLNFLAADGLQFVNGKLFVSYHGGIQRLNFTNGQYTHAAVKSSENVPTGLSTLTEARGKLYAIDSEIVPITQPQLGLPVTLPNKIFRVKFK